MAETTNLFAGTAIFNPGFGQTPFGTYDSQGTYNTDVETTALWCAKRLGYPIVDIELQDVHFFACFEEAVTEYGAQIQRYQIRQNLLDATSQPKTNLTTGSADGLNGLISLTEHYGTETLTGGNTDLKSGYISVTSGSQVYDLQSLWGAVSESGKRLEVRKVFHDRTPASIRHTDQYALGNNSAMAVSEFGLQNRGAGVSFMMLPIYDILLRQQQVEFSDLVRKSQYSFELQNNKIRLFPKPTTDFKMWFQYFVKDDKYTDSLGDAGTVSNFADIDYRSLNYSTINAPGIQWIRKYALALSKELLGIVRSKYSSIPTPGGDITVDGDTLRSEGASEKESLVATLREDLEASSRRNMLEAKKDEAEFLRETITNIPLNIYIG